MESASAEGRTVYQQRQPQRPLSHPPATSKRTAKKATQHRRDNFYATAEAALRALHADEFDAFGTTVAAKLRKMSDIQRHIAERIISDVLFRGVMNELSTHNAMAPVMPATLHSQEPSIIQCALHPQFCSANPCTFTTIAPGVHHHVRRTACPSSPPNPPVATVTHSSSSTSSFSTQSIGSGDVDVYNKYYHIHSTHNQQ